MKMTYNIFNKLKISHIALALVMLVVPAFAADNGCDDAENDRIVPVLALCSSHAYNIRFSTNPATDSDKQLMRDVVALKSTVMMQQMYKQYEFLEATLNRLKTQLEREILTSKFQVAGASPSSSSGGASASTDRNVVLIGAENCLLKSTVSDGLTCIQNNVRVVLQAVSSGNIGEAYRQLQKDLEFARAYGVTGVTYDANSQKYTAPASCADLRAHRDTVNSCAYELNIAIMRAIETRNNQNQRNNNNMPQNR